jgi:vanillate/3-O-methylgallate O-demethylase
MSSQSLEDLLQKSGSAVNLLRDSQIGAYVYPVVTAEYSNWRDEQRAWRDSCILFDLSHHMVNLYIEGPDAVRLVSNLGLNSFANFSLGKAKQYSPCSHDGYVIGDGILIPLEQNKLVFVGRAPAASWIEFHAATGGYNVKTAKDDRSPSNPAGKAVTRTVYRYQIQGPNAAKLLEKLNGGPLPTIKFFNLGTIRIGGRSVRALYHGMAGTPGLEIWGPYEEREEIRAIIVEAGREFDLHQVGSRVYATNTLESGWIPSPLPAVYSGDQMKAYRQWLPSNGWEGTASLGGSFYSNNVEDYYVTPYEMGYAPFIKFDHDFIGRQALEKMAGQPHRKKVTFAWNSDDVVKAYRSMFEQGAIYRYIDLPLSNYASASYDKIVAGGKTVGVSMFAGYSFNERSMLSLGVVEPNIALGTQVTLVWGEEGGGSKKVTVERHRQIEIRATVCAAPYSEVVRAGYGAGGGWRTQQA